MADRILLNASKGKPKSLSLCNKKLTNVPKIIGIIISLRSVDLKNNKLTGLPKEMSSLNQVVFDSCSLFICQLAWFVMVIYSWSEVSRSCYILKLFDYSIVLE